MKKIEEMLELPSPERLYHYTNSAGLRGILGKGAIWCGSAFHMNDSREFRYALDTIIARVNARALNVLQRTEGLHAFVASFSKEGDLLSQWLAYSDGATAGYSIELNPAHFDQAKQDGFVLVQCVYNKEEQESLADAVIDVFCTKVDFTNSDDYSRQLRKAILAATAIKQPGFEQEREWRLVKIKTPPFDDLTDLCFRDGRSGIVPFLEARLVESEHQLAPARITIGRALDSYAAKAGLDIYLQSLGLRNFLFSKTAVDELKTPYRP